MEPGEKCWIRITTLNDEIANVLESKVVRRIPDRLPSHKMNFRVDDIVINRREHEWAGETSFSEIAQDAALATDGHHVRMEFTSPSAF